LIFHAFAVPILVCAANARHWSGSLSEAVAEAGSLA
jgi:hypothetical protein